MARLWQTAILSKWEEAFEYIPIENLIKKHQQEYYKVINNCDKTGNSNEFIEFIDFLKEFEYNNISRSNSAKELKYTQVKKIFRPEKRSS